MRMFKKFKDMWTTALRSEDYEQGSGCLVEDDLYCCLGVLGSELEARDYGSFDDWGYFRYAGVQHSKILPWTAAKLVGLDDGNPSIHIPDVKGDVAESTSLAELNDEGVPFYQIADLIDYFL